MPPEHSGAAKQALTLAKQLKKEGFEIQFLTQASYAENIHNNLVEEFKVIRIFKGSLFFKALAPIRFFYNLVLFRDNFEIIHVHGIGYLSKIAVIFGILFRKPVLLKMTMFTEDDPLSIINSKFGKLHFWFFSKANGYVAILDSFKQSYYSTSLDKEKLHIIPNGVDINRFRPVKDHYEKTRLRKKLNLPDKKHLLIYAGIIRPEKGIELLIESAKILNRANGNIHLVLIGPIEKWLPEIEQKAIRGYLEEFKTHGFIHYHGNQDNVEEYFRCADFFISASKKEGLQNVLLEAMASGLPSICTEISGMHENILTSGEFVLIKNYDALSLAEAALSLLANPDEQVKISKSARSLILNKYNLTNVIEKYNLLYNQLNKLYK